jgi:LPXTG-site transpeptidase (sortase) family protein
LSRHRRKRSGRLALGTALAAAVVCAGGASVAAFGVFDGTPAQAGATYIPPSITTIAPRLASDPGARPLARSAPVTIRIPRIGVNAPVMKLGRDADGTVQVPPLAAHNLTGWYRYGPSPGQRGPAVILGHVDSTAGISVFYYLKNLHTGDTVLVTLADGKVAAFAVDGLQRVAKDAFPTASVYGKSGYPSLRLITCGGPFDQATGHYTDNIIVYAHLVPAGS